MVDYTLPDLAKKMADLDFAMLFTRSEGGELAGRPMSNNGEVEFEGDAYFFTYSSSRIAQDIAKDTKVGLSYQGSGGLLGKPPIFIALEADGSLIRNKAAFAERWSKDLDRWFEQGVDTPGLVMIKVSATRIHYWDGVQEGDVDVHG